MTTHSDTRTHPGSRRGRWSRPLRLTGLLGAAALLSGCGIDNEQAFELFGLPEPASDQAFLVGDLWVGTWIAALAVGALVWGLIAWASIVYRRKRAHDDHLPEQVRYNIPIETLYTVVPLFIVAVLFFWTFQNGDEVLAKSENPDVRIGVVGQQWSWTFNYLDEDVYDVGTAATIPQLYLPVNQTVEFTLNSPDVIHSFWIPSFYFKMDLIPGRTNSFQVTPSREGVFAGRCSELCGTYHSRMLFQAVVVSEEEYQAHLEELRAKGQTGIVEVPVRAAFDLDQIAEEPAEGNSGGTE
jgi:cytochrome c oxidase subunit 2